MNVDVEVKIKLEKGKQIVLKNEDAKELYEKLKEIYAKDTTWYPLQPWYPVQPYYEFIPTFTTTSGICTVTTNNKTGTTTVSD